MMFEDDRGGRPRVRDFERNRDHAMIRVLAEGYAQMSF
jgi:hypothetical protein